MIESLNYNLPLFTSNFRIFDFDSSSIKERYRLVSENCDLEINRNVKKLLDFISTNEGQNLFVLIDKFCEENIVCKEDLERTISMLAEKGVLKNKKEERRELKEENFHRNKMDHLWYRRKLIDTEKHEIFFRFFSFVFAKPFVITIFFFFLLFDVIFIYSYFFTEWKEKLIFFSSFDYLSLSVYGWISLFLHETGHIAAAKRYNSKTGGIGLGIYYYVLVGYADVHETWNLPRQQRRYVSIAGFYWNIISILPIYGLCFYWSSKALADFILLFHISFISVFNPFLKMDGYWFLSDTLGVPNLQNRIKTYFSTYLPAIYLNKQKINNPFQSYPLRIRNLINIYIVLFILFMVVFISLFLYKAVDIILDYDNKLVKYLAFLWDKWDSTSFNKLLRNIFILFGGIMITQKYIRRIIKSVITLINTSNKSKYEKTVT